MRILILGVSGMLGHKLYQYLGKKYECFGTVRNFNSHLVNTHIFDKSKIITGIDILKFSKLTEIVKEIKPKIIINCVGIIKQKDDSNLFKKSIYVNSYFPHLVAELCDKFNIKLFHISTDCVFDGKRGNYLETEQSNAIDLYGRSKFLGEINYGNSLTVRTSIIGHELFTYFSLVDWFINQNGRVVNGYYHAIYTGFPTIYFAEILDTLFNKYFDIKGLIQISSPKINKFDLLNLIKNQYGLNIIINQDTDFICDRSLDSTYFRTVTDITIPEWDELIYKMFLDYKETNYISWKKY